MSGSGKHDKFICLALAALLGCAALAMEWRVVYHEAKHLQVPGCICAGLSALLMLSAGFAPARVLRWQKAAAIIALNTGIVLGLAEIACRVMRVDFNLLLGLREKNAAFPIFFRLPDRPIGDVFFTRQGPASWTGKPLSIMLRNHRGTDDVYRDEREITVSYDQDGFRNPEDLRDWDIAVAGDSFTESGYLPYESLFTTILGESLHQRVKNLGVSDTGNFTHAFYLRACGRSPSCRLAILGFFEGNDLDDDVAELRDLQKHRATGERPCREVGRESSLLKTMYGLACDWPKMHFRARSYANAVFTANGAEIPVTIADAPPARDEVTSEQKAAFAAALGNWAGACRENGVASALLYIPCKRRVWHDHLRLREDCPEPEWRLNDLPAFVAEMAAVHGIRFIDATPALVKRTEKGVLTFNPIYDTHLNAEGHRAVAETVAEALKNSPPEKEKGALSAAGR